ncbi:MULTISPECIES: sodium:proton exchanger [unclassified Brevibacterium]|uniref:sodium:proton exchanger n=1 Tax=unclassified Brevibacterium TaxID=2614124 RepID=UPI001E40F775|nr:MULTISPECIES: sodium:proton exchanger [unclassified Brevibacterium]MCD1286361.1 sodium:proton exchanger [Brevibacterium sp. CCUG 69071]MDK8433727.1 sodium:proton exchanger [Brevibacterium sp. H-BE7]
MPAAIVRRIVLCLVIASPALILRITGIELAPPLELLAFGAAIVSAAFLLAWAAEAAQKDISGALAIALLALIAVLPEYAVDLYYAFRSGSDPEYLHFAAANMTGSNRLLLGFGWPLVVVIALLVARRIAKRTKSPVQTSLRLESGSRMDIGFLVILGVIAFAIPLLGSIPVWFGIALILIFIAYLWRAGSAAGDENEEFVGAAALIVEMPTRARRITVVAMFLVSAAIILTSAEPFAEALVASGSALGIDSYFLVQWLAPLASEAPEFIIAAMFALRGMGGAAIGTLIASKVNQWSLLVGSLPVAHLFGGGDVMLPLDGRQIEEFTLTATQTILGVAIILALRFHWVPALGLAALFGLQFFITDTTGRYVLSAIQAGLAIVFLIIHRRDIVPTLRAPFRRPEQVVAEVEEESETSERVRA